MTKHTPGPWKVSQPSYWINAPHCCERGPMHVADARGWGHLTGKGHGAHGMEAKEAIAIQEANAKLIAAAPDLLAACQAMAEWDAAENQLPPYDSDNGASFDQCMALCRDAFDKARAAIAKATGEQS